MLHSKSTYFYRWSSRYISIAPIACALTLLVGVGFLLNPTARAQEVYAAGESGPATTESSISFSFNNNTQPNTSTTVEPGYVSYIPNVFAVNTTNIYKYDMYITAAEGHTEELVGTTYHGIINGVGSNIAPDNFGENTWGYAFSTDTTVEDSAMAYSTLPAHGTKVNPQYSTDYNLNDTESREFKIVFAARIMGDTRPADHYYSQALISVVAESKEIVEGFGGVQTMQEFTPEICKHKVSAGATGRLEDTRKNADGSTRVYWVAKLADGNCWMTQNLDYDDPNSTRVTGAGAWSTTDNDVRSYYDNGEKVLNGASWVDVSGPDWTPFIDDNVDKIVDTSIYKYNAHYLSGNYYTYVSATNGTGASDIVSSKGDATGSICPMNWKLPNKNDFELFLTAYKLTNTTPSSTAIRQRPLYFHMFGSYTGVGFDYVNSRGTYWSSTSDGSSAVRLFIDSSGVSVNAGGGTTYRKYYGNSVRCVVPSN